MSEFYITVFYPQHKDKKEIKTYIFWDLKEAWKVFKTIGNDFHEFMEPDISITYRLYKLIQAEPLIRDDSLLAEKTFIRY